MKSRSSKYFQRTLLFFFGISLTFQALAQKPSLKFTTDSVRIGNTIAVSLSYKHASSLEVFFPDSSFNFRPFELQKINYFTTSTHDTISVDSVVYELKTFEISKIQRLQMPVWQMIHNDSISIFSNQDSVILKEMITDSLLTKAAYKSMTAFVPVLKETNYPDIIKWVLIIPSLIMLLYFLFGKRIYRQYRLFLFARKQKSFNVKFKKLMKTEYSTENLNNAVVLWKSQMEWLERKPFRSLSSSEIMKFTGNENLGEALKEIDLSVYGGIRGGNLPLALQIMYKVANDTFKIKRRGLNRRLKV